MGNNKQEMNYKWRKETKIKYIVDVNNKKVTDKREIANSTCNSMNKYFCEVGNDLQS